MSGTVLNYYLCTLWIFKIRVVQNRYHEFFCYIFITGISLGINTLLIWGITEFVGLYFMLSKALATFVTFWWNFGARKYFLHTI
jgi:putative flippase GtrA